MSTEGVTPTEPVEVAARPDPSGSPADEATDLLLADVDLPAFKAQEPYTGLPKREEVFAALPEDAQKHVHNIRLGAQKMVERAKAAEAEAKARAEALAAWERELAEREARLNGSQPAPVVAPPVDGLLGNERVRRVLGMEDGDYADDMPTFEDVDLAELLNLDEDALVSPAELQKRITVALKTYGDKLRQHAEKVADVRARAAAKAVTAPALAQIEAQRKAQEEAQRQELVQKVRSWRTERGMVDDDAFVEVLSIAESHNLNPAAVGDTSWLDDALALWARRNPTRVPAPPASAKAADVSPPAPVREKPNPLAALRAAAQAATGKPSTGMEKAVPRMPSGLTASQELDWLNKHPEAKRLMYEDRVRYQKEVLGGR